MTEAVGDYSVGYCKPPKHTQFAKGQSGNPTGRPKGSQNLSTIFQKVARQRVKVTDSRGSRSMTKLEAAATQLSNQAASGDPRAIRDFLFWSRQLEEPAHADPEHSGQKEVDRAVVQNILKRLRRSEDSGSANPGGSNSAEEV